MRTVQMTLDENLVKAVDRLAKRLNITRSSFTRRALQNAIHSLNMHEMEKKHCEGYTKKPVKKAEFGIWENEQAWGDK